MKKYQASFLFIVLLIGVSFYYGYQDITFKRPQSVHAWRQSDCASIALNYYQEKINFFRPETHNLTSDSGTSGKCVTSEIPILYYSVAALYSVFGYHEYIYRIFNTLLFFLGLFFLFRLLHYLLQDVFWAISLTLLFFTSPVLVFYGNNFLSNSSSLAFSIIGWYYFICFIYEGKVKWFYVSMAVFLLAAAFKVTALFSLFAIAGIFIFEKLGVNHFKGDKKLFEKPLRMIIPIISIFIVIGMWLVYASYYNQQHDCYYFSTTIFPIWKLDKTAIYGVIENTRKIWLDQYFHKSVFVFLAFCFLFILFSFRKSNKVLFYAVLFIFAEALVYIILQFWTFADHDYYTIDIYILVALVILVVFDILKRYYPKIFKSILLKSLFSLFLLFNIYYASQKINERYTGWINDYPKNRDIYSITPYLRQIGILPTDTVISIPDYSNVSLYLMNQKGWTEYTDTRLNMEEQITYNRDSAEIQHSVDKGAKYLIINGIEELYSKPYLQSFCSNLAGRYNNVLIFNLKNNERNFNITKRTISKVYTCNAESRSKDHHYFASDIDSSLVFRNGETQSVEFAHTGKHSSRLDEHSPYGMTISFNDLKVGESFIISVWRKITTNSKGGLIASSNSPNPYYNGDFRILTADKNGWEKIGFEIFISSESEGQELKIYVYNPEPEPVYFDDFEIIRYKSVVDLK
jgi:hypothetical protein